MHATLGKLAVAAIASEWFPMRFPRKDRGAIERGPRIGETLGPAFGVVKASGLGPDWALSELRA